LTVSAHSGEPAGLFIQGDPAPLIGRTCRRLVAVAFVVDGAVRDDANEVLIETAEDWTQLCFDHGLVFWRPDREAPEPYAGGPGEGSFVLTEIEPAAGRRIVAIDTDIGEIETRVTLRLDGLEVLLIHDRGRDATVVSVQPPQDR
jgi:hypothetical protein